MNETMSTSPSTSASAEDAIRDYYEALRRGEPLYPYFLESDSTVKFGITESLFGAEAVGEALREQTRTTEDWTVESHRLAVEEYGDVARFADEVTLAWTDRESGERTRFESRWSGTLERRGEEWLFTVMHVSAPPEPESESERDGNQDGGREQEREREPEHAQER